MTGKITKTQGIRGREEKSLESHVVSPDGKLIAFVRRVRMQSVLFLHDLETGEEWPLFDDLHKDQMETWATFGVYPNYNWTPDGKYIIINAKGKFKKINVERK